MDEPQLGADLTLRNFLALPLPVAEGVTEPPPSNSQLVSVVFRVWCGLCCVSMHMCVECVSV